MASQQAPPLTPRQRAGVVAVLAGAAAWFVVSWTVRNKPLVEAVGEPAGAASVALLVISVVGVTRQR